MRLFFDQAEVSTNLLYQEALRQTHGLLQDLVDRPSVTEDTVPKAPFIPGSLIADYGILYDPDCVNPTHYGQLLYDIEPGLAHLDGSTEQGQRIEEDTLTTMYQAMIQGLGKPWSVFNTDRQILRLPQYKPLARQVALAQSLWLKHLKVRQIPLESGGYQFRPEGVLQNAG